MASIEDTKEATMRKGFVFGAILLLGMAATVSAAEPSASAGMTTLNGTFSQNAGSIPSLVTADSGTWFLVLPGMSRYDIPVNNGDKISVTGIEIQGPTWARSGERYLVVQTVSLAGKEYILPRIQGQSGAMGPYGMNGWGRNDWGYSGAFGYGRGCGW